MGKILKLIGILFCIHNMESVKDSSWYFHTKCTKCGFEKGMGNFTY